jgi:hypothetical protein
LLDPRQERSIGGSNRDNFAYSGRRRVDRPNKQTGHVATDAVVVERL